MDLKLCRTCGKNGRNFIHIFQTEGLKNKIETCLPIAIFEHTLLPDTICPECLISIEHFYVFIKTCLENIIILETRLDIQESCLKAQRRKDKSASACLPLPNQTKAIQTEDYLDILLGDKKQFPLTYDSLKTNKYILNTLVDYEIDSDSNSSGVSNDVGSGQVILTEKLEGLNIINNFVNRLFSVSNNVSSANNVLVDSQGQKRRSESPERVSPKYSRTDSGNKRKFSKPKKLDTSTSCNEEEFATPVVKKEVVDGNYEDECNGGEQENNEEQEEDHEHCCLLCNVQLESSTSLAEHFMKFHTKEPKLDNSVYESVNKPKKSLPSLLKISDLKKSEACDDSLSSRHQLEEKPLNLTITCTSCSTVFATKTELFVHLQLNHSEVAIYLCGICLKQLNSLSNLKCHIVDCIKTQPVTNRYLCQVCYFGHNNYRSMESHVLVHNFLWKDCQKEIRNFDPEDYILQNPEFTTDCASPVKNFSCLECKRYDFDTFRKFSEHRRNIHSIFHCDLCNKFYGRNSHLWKHVNRLHKNHPSITCQICFKTSASKYHLAQHFAKIHQTKNVVTKQEPCEENEEKPIASYGSNSFFRIQDSIDQENPNSSNDEASLNQSSQSDNENSVENISSPRSCHDTVVKTEEELHNCPKCSKVFHKRTLLKKHKKNCRPKLQKDLLTRCKTCSRTFKDRHSLAKHLVNYHSDYECDICNEKVPSKCGIISHIRFQHPYSHLICSICFNVLRSREDLLSHLADHENSFVCQFCGDALTSKVKLKMHILSLHRKILNLSCGICLKLFDTQQALRNHVHRSHGDKLIPLISCPVCGKNYGSKWKTFDHVTKSHGKVFKACKVCLELYETEHQLEVHIKAAHSNYQPLPNKSVKPNPLAILGTSVKREELEGNSNHEIDSNSGENSEETENSQSSDSEYDDSLDQAGEDRKSTTTTTLEGIASSQESKMSLLEKRLLGSAFNQNINNLCLPNNDSNTKVVGEMLTCTQIKNEEEMKFPCKKSDSHSKRTVYENSNDPCFCEICHKTWPAKKHLWQHYIRCHKRVAATVCGICLKTNEDYESLQTHLRETHPALLHGQGFGSNFICRICGRYHNASSKLRLHMVIHEKFDWTLLDKFPPLSKSNTRNNKENGTQHNEIVYSKIKKEMNHHSDEIYDAMIEQVEESNSSTEIRVGHTAQDSTSDSGEPTNSGLQGQLSFSNLLETLKSTGQLQLSSDHSAELVEDKTVREVGSGSNIRAESVIHLRQGNNVAAIDNTSSAMKVGRKHQSSISEECSSTSESELHESKRGLFSHKPEELDSAVKSISVDRNELQTTSTYNNVNGALSQNNSCLNETEIESAVDSIL